MIILEILAPIVIYYGSIIDREKIKYSKLSVIILVIFTIIVNFVYFYPPKGQKYNSFMKNTILILLSFFINEFK